MSDESGRNGEVELETARLAMLDRSALLDSEPEESFDRLTRLATRALRAPISLISLVDRDRQFFKSAVGLSEPWASRRETPLLLSLCQEAVRTGRELVIHDARRDRRFDGHRAVSELGVIAYLGVPLTLSNGHRLGAFCVIDSRSRRWSLEQIRLLRDLSASVVSEIELRLHIQSVAQARRASEESEARLRLLLESTGEGIYGIDREGLCTFSNRAAAEALGYSREDLVGEEMHTLIHHSHADGSPYPGPACPIYRTFRTGESTHVEGEVLWRKDGSSFDAEYWSYPIRRGSEVVGAVVTFRDITERKRSAATLEHYMHQLEETDRRKDEFLAVLGHELRNPLAAISAAAELLASGPESATDPRWAGQMVSEQVSLLTALLDDLLDVGRITRGEIQLKRAVCSAATVVQKAMLTARPLLESRKHRVAVHVAEALHVDADPMRLEQVLVNLLTNAAKYTDPGGEIEVRAWPAEPDALFSVRDNGRGIRPDRQRDVFEPFRQVDAVEDYRGGLGIGLTLIRRLVELHGGAVTLDSEGEGCGCLFTVRLPGALRPPAESAPEAQPEPGGPEKPAAGLPRRVLVVDDNQQAADGITRLLEREGFSVEAVYAGGDALSKVRARPFDAMLVDIALPDISGYEIAERVRADPELRGMTLIALSGFGHAEARAAAHEAGFDHHVAKPARLVDLKALLSGPSDGTSLAGSG